jgi:hypothetical protein
MTPAMREQSTKRLVLIRKRLARLYDQYEYSSRMTGGQVSDKTRVEMPHIKHIGAEIKYWEAEETKLVALLDPDRASAYVPMGTIT